MTMTDNDILQQIRDMRYPYTVDVVNQVMEQVRNKPLLVPRQTHGFNLRHVATAVAACLLLAVGINFTLLFTHDYNEAQIGNMIADVYAFHADYGSSADSYSDLGAIVSFY